MGMGCQLLIFVDVPVPGFPGLLTLVKYFRLGYNTYKYGRRMRSMGCDTIRTGRKIIEEKEILIYETCGFTDERR